MIFYMPVLSIIIPCLHCYHHLASCFNDLAKQSLKDFEVIVINNEADKDIIELCRMNQQFFAINTLNELTNSGYAKAVNSGILLAHSSLIVVLNADISFQSDFLLKLNKATVEDKKSVFILHIKKQNGYLTESKGVYLDSFLRGHNALKKGQAIGPQGAAFAFNKSILGKISNNWGTLFDERYFFLWEDIELSLRLQKHRIKISLLDNVICNHYGNSTNSNYHYKQYLSMRNRFLLIKDYFPRYLLRYFLIVLIYDIPRLICFLVFNPYRAELFNFFNKKGLY